MSRFDQMESKLKVDFGHSRLTPAERCIASFVAEYGLGLGPREIARRLGKSEGTVKQQLGRIYRKLGLRGDGKVALVQLAVYWNCEIFQIGLAA